MRHLPAAHHPGHLGHPLTGATTMGYVATKGGEDAIANANQLVEFYKIP